MIAKRSGSAQRHRRALVLVTTGAGQNQWGRDMVDAHPTAVVSPDAQVAAGVSVGPYAVIEAGAVIAEGVTVGAHAIVCAASRIGQHVSIGAHALIGFDPQDLSFTPSVPTEVVIGPHTVIREAVSIHRATGSEPTRIGTGCFLMGGVHIGHDCQVGDRVILTQGAVLGGHAVVDDDAVVGGMAGVHQWVRIGRGAMVGGLARVVQDVLPYHVADGHPARHWQINTVGLRRQGVTADELAVLRHAFLALQRGDNPGQPASRQTDALHQFLAGRSKRGIAPFARSASTRGQS